MKRICLFLLVLAMVFSASCNKNDDNIVSGSNTEAIIGTWKLVEETTDGVSRTLSDCEKQETYIFGAEQLTHEVFSGSGDDSDDETDDETDDSTDDSTDDNTDDETDEDSDDDHDDDSDDEEEDDDDRHNKAEACNLLSQKLAFWSNEGAYGYKFTYPDATENHNVIFTESNNRFYFEKTETTNGVTKVKRYVFQRQ